MPDSPESTDALLTKLIQAESVDDAAEILSGAGYKLTAVAAEAPETEPTDDESTDDGGPDSGSKDKGGFSFLRKKMAENLK